MTEFLSVEEVATALKVHQNTVYKWLNAGGLCGTKIGGAWRIRQSDIDSLFNYRRNSNVTQNSNVSNVTEEVVASDIKT